MYTHSCPAFRPALILKPQERIIFMKKRSAVLLLVLAIFVNFGMARQGQYDEDAREQERLQRQMAQEAGQTSTRPVRNIASGIKEITYDNVRDVTKDTAKATAHEAPVVGTLDGSQKASEKVVDNTIRGVKKVASLGLARDDSYSIEEAEKGSGDAAKIKLFQF